jgi:hypothetical protein
MTPDARRGSATVEHVALAVLIALLVIAAISALIANPPSRGERALGSAIARKIACAPRIPDPCHRNPLALAYGFPLGKLVRLLSPRPRDLVVAGVAAVDFRRCRRPSCAVPSAGDPGLTSSNRRLTAFTQVEDLRRSGGEVRVTYWLYRPGLGWSKLVRAGGRAEIDAAQALRLRLDDDPALVPLETLPGHNHYRFPRGEEPPWRWRVDAVYPD